METTFLDNISVSQIGRAVILVVIFKTDVIVDNVIMYLTSH